ncbi:BgTH12-00022 [Blumeria graminis f. sp. triticale]|uniref:BgTH12-00022 n=1 Tax=Blumeria graminis f. sp. triticale TaxID=1689686 RepID=A0A9W4D9S4_BLUGR|nr:BgTH12-00022 [Blumeria graminis f. sp. triticale]
MKIVLPHLAIALLSVVAPALAVMYDCFGTIIDGDVVKRAEASHEYASTSKVALIKEDSKIPYTYFDIHTTGQYSERYTGFACFVDTAMTKPDVRKHHEETWWPCNRLTSS